MTSALTTIALLVLGAAICPFPKFAHASHSPCSSRRPPPQRQTALFNGVLALSVSPGFETNNRIKCTITPGNSSGLSGVHNSGTGNLVMGPGFRAKNFTIASTAVGNTFVFGLTTSTADVLSVGSSTVLLNGNVNDGGILVTGDTSKVYLTGAIGGTLDVSLEDSSSTYVQGLPGTVILGDIDPSAEMRFTAGTCRLQSGSCTRVQSDGAPSFAPSWSCGLQVEGESTCTSDEAISSPLIPEDVSLANTASGMSVVRVRCLDPNPLNIF
ncbi:hypothetical protein V8C86DRAFT_2557876 [Haematococcus lacustris]